MLKIAEIERKKDDISLVNLHPISHTVLRVSNNFNLSLFGLEDTNNRLEVNKAKKI